MSYYNAQKTDEFVLKDGYLYRITPRAKSLNPKLRNIWYQSLDYDSPERVVVDENNPGVYLSLIHI